MRMMLREVAAGTGVSYESLSRDYSQSNYSSSRLALLDDRDLWRMLQLWFIRSFRARVHKLWLQQAVLARAIASIPVEPYALNVAKYEAVRFKPRGWSWVDPTTEVQAYEQAIRNGFTTVSAVIASTGDGRDLEDVMKERKDELAYMESQGLVFDNDPSTVKTAAAEAAGKAKAAMGDPAAAATPVDPAAAKKAGTIIPMHAGGRHG
jgi:lambda family phage portal protein